MNNNIEFLKLMYKNAKMGIVGIENIKNGIKDKEFGKLIREQENDYYDICTRISNSISYLGKLWRKTNLHKHRNKYWRHDSPFSRGRCHK